MREKNLVCPFTECSKNGSCIIIDITKKVPESFDSCTYAETKELSQKRAARAAKAAAIVIKKPKRRKTKESEKE
jgi:hypothetical protein